MQLAQNTRMLSLSQHLKYSGLQTMPYRQFFGKNKAYREGQEAKQQKEETTEQTTQDKAKDEKETSAEERKEPDEQKPEQKADDKLEEEKESTTAENKETDQKEQEGSPGSSSSEEISDEEVLTKEDRDKLTKLFNEQEAEIKVLEKQIERQKKEIQVVRVEYTKQVKENEATVKRYRKMIGDEKQFAISKFAKDLLEVRDAIRLGVEHVSIDQIKELDHLNTAKNQFVACYEGQVMTAEVMDRVLERFKVTQYDPKGQKFDATLHEAVFTVAKSENENDTVEVVMQTGWKIGERVLRAAKVGIVKK